MDLEKHPSQLRVNTGGNYCGHDPESPTFSTPYPLRTGAGGIPRVLSLCAERLTRYYTSPRLTLPSLDRANGSTRQQRSERREACYLFLATLLKFTELASLRVGIPTPDGFVNLTVDLIARHSGLGLRRAERVMRDLKAAGLLTVAQQRVQLSDDRWIGLAAVKAISRDLFGALGLSRMLAAERKKASKRLLRKMNTWSSRPRSEKDRSKHRLWLRSLGLVNERPKRKQRNYSSDPPEDLEYRKKRTAIALELRKQHPDWDHEKLLREATRRLRGHQLH